MSEANLDPNRPDWAPPAPEQTAEAVAKGRRYMLVGLLIAGSSIPVFAISLLLFWRHLGPLAAVLVIALVADLVLGMYFIVQGRRLLTESETHG